MIRSSWVPLSMMRPWSRTMIASSILNGGQAVSDVEGGASVHQGVHTSLNNSLGVGIDGAGGLIQDHNRRIRHSRPGDGKKLPLALA